MNTLDPRLIVALDFPTEATALEFACKLDPQTCRVKVGLELFTLAGFRFIEKLHQLGFSVFLDLKFHDIPNTVAGACRSAANLGVWMINVHAAGGSAMLNAARQAVLSCAHQPLIVAVTLLTSIAEASLSNLGIHETSEQYVLRLASLAKQAELNGIVCSGREVATIHAHCGDKFLTVVPGLRPAGADNRHDQARTVTPEQALAAGASYLVLGRMITESADPQAVIAQLLTKVNH